MIEANGTFMSASQYAQYKQAVLESHIYAVFMVICNNMDCDPNHPFPVKYQNSAMVTNVSLKCEPGTGCIVDTNNLDGFWSDPISWFHKDENGNGLPSWYSGFFSDTPHLIGSDPASAHIDPFGPFNPLHYLIQIPAMKFPAGASGTMTCSVNGGCN